MERRAKGKRSLRNRRSEVQEKLSGGRLSPGRPGVPGERRAAAPPHPERTLHRRPHRPSAGLGPGSDRERPGEGPERARGAARRRPLPAGPVGNRDRGRGRGGPEPGETEKTVRGLPLARLGHLHRLSDGGARRLNGRIRPSAGKHHPALGPLTSPSQQPQPPQRRSRFVTAARLLAQRGPRACALVPVPREPGRVGSTWDQQVPGPAAPPPAFSRLPLLPVPSPLSA